jgi:hypothetical protein
MTPSSRQSDTDLAFVGIQNNFPKEIKLDGCPGRQSRRGKNVGKHISSFMLKVCGVIQCTDTIDGNVEIPIGMRTHGYEI